MSFQQFCCSVVGRYQQVQALFAYELQLSTRFPFHCQDRFLLWFKWGSENEIERNVENVSPKGPQLDPKSRQKSIKACSGGVSKRDLKKVPSPGPGKVRFCCYLLHFSKVGGLRKGTLFGNHFGTIWETKSMK